MTMKFSCGYITFWHEIWFNPEYLVNEPDEHNYKLVAKDTLYWLGSEEIYNLYKI